MQAEVLRGLTAAVVSKPGVAVVSGSAIDTGSLFGSIVFPHGLMEREYNSTYPYFRLTGPANVSKGDHIPVIERAFNTYINAVETNFKEGQRPPARRGCLVEWLNKDDHLRALVKQLEDGHEFSALLEETCSAYRSDGGHSVRDESWWREPVDVQALRYASYVSKWKFEDFENHARNFLGRVGDPNFNFRPGLRPQPLGTHHRPLSARCSAQSPMSRWRLPSR